MREELEALWIQPDGLSTGVFVLLVASVAALLIFGVGYAGRALGEDDATRRRWMLGAVGVVGLVAVVSSALPLSGFAYAELPVPPLMMFFLGSNLLAAALALSPVGTRLVAGLPILAFVAPQALRFPLELILHHWYDLGMLPVQMTYEGRNFDILTGIAALLLTLYALRTKPSRGVYLAFNVLGIGLLFAVMTIALTSTPVPFRLYPDPPVLLPYHWPFVWIVPFAVSAALFGHILTFRALYRGAEWGASTTTSESTAGT